MNYHLFFWLNIVVVTLRNLQNFPFYIPTLRTYCGYVGVVTVALIHISVVLIYGA